MGAVLIGIHWVANVLLLAICLRQILLFPLLTGRFRYRTHASHRSVFLLGGGLVAASALLTVSSLLSGEDLAFRLFLLACAVATMLVQMLRGEGIATHGLLFANLLIPAHRIRSWKLAYLNEREAMLIVKFDRRRWGETAHSVAVPMDDLPGVTRAMEEMFGKPSEEDIAKR